MNSIYWKSKNGTKTYNISFESPDSGQKKLLKDRGVAASRACHALFKKLIIMAKFKREEFNLRFPQLDNKSIGQCKLVGQSLKKVISDQDYPWIRI